MMSLTDKPNISETLLQVIVVQLLKLGGKPLKINHQVLCVGFYRIMVSCVKCQMSMHFHALRKEQAQILSSTWGKRGR